MAAIPAENSNLLQVMLDWHFPGSTCEAVGEDSFVHQPVSTMVILLTIARCVYHLGQASDKVNFSTTVAAVSICVFELFHAMSHAFSIQGLDYAQHFTSYQTFLVMGWALSETVGGLPDETWWRAGVAVFVVGDIMFSLLVGINIFSVLGTVVFFLFFFTPFLGKLDNGSRQHMTVMGGALAFMVTCLVTESFWCFQLLELLPYPPHVMVEIGGFFFFEHLTLLILHAKPKSSDDQELEKRPRLSFSILNQNL